jgi:hypothetical protein
VLPGLKFRAKGASATFIILIALSSLVVLTQINSFIIPSKTDQYADKLSAVLYKHGLLDKSNKIDDIDAAISYIDNYLEKAVKGLDTWRLSTKLGIYDPKSGGSTLMSDAEVQKIMRNKDALKVKVESVPKIGPFGTNVWIDKLLYFPTEIKNIDDVRKNIEESQDDINIEFEVQRPGDNNIYRQSVNLNKMSLANEIEFRESKEKVSESKPKSCDMNQDGLTLSINLDDHRMWIGPCIFLDYRGG